MSPVVADYALVAMVLGCYIFSFTLWRSISNHINKKLESIETRLTKLHIEFTERVTRIETKLGTDNPE